MPLEIELRWTKIKLSIKIVILSCIYIVPLINRVFKNSIPLQTPKQWRKMLYAISSIVELSFVINRIFSEWLKQIKANRGNRRLQKESFLFLSIKVTKVGYSRGSFYV